MNEVKTRKRRKNVQLRLSQEKGTGRYYTAYTNAQGKTRKKRFTRNKDESTRLFKRFQVELDGGRLAPDEEEPVARTDGTESPLSLFNLIREYTATLRNKIRDEADGHADDGTITQQTYDLHCNVCKRLAKYCQGKFGEDKLRATPFHLLFNEIQYEAMFDAFKQAKMSGSYMGKIKARFWDIARTSWRNHKVSFRFNSDQVPVKISQKAVKPTTIPAIPWLRKALAETACFNHQVWIWLAMGCGFGPQDLAVLTPRHFDFENDTWFPYLVMSRSGGSCQMFFHVTHAHFSQDMDLLPLPGKSLKEFLRDLVQVEPGLIDADDVSTQPVRDVSRPTRPDHRIENRVPRPGMPLDDPLQQRFRHLTDMPAPLLLERSADARKLPHRIFGIDLETLEVAGHSPILAEND